MSRRLAAILLALVSALVLGTGVGIAITHGAPARSSSSVRAPRPSTRSTVSSATIPPVAFPDLRDLIHGRSHARTIAVPTTVAELRALPAGVEVPERTFDVLVPAVTRPATISTAADTVARASVVRSSHGMTISWGHFHDPVIPEPVRDGTQVVLDGYHTMSWAESSVRPGARHGVTALYAHRDGSRGEADVAFLITAKKGATVTMAVGGRSIRYRLTRVQHVRAGQLPLALLDRTGTPRLAVVSCAGNLVKGADGSWGHADRAVAWLSPAI